jgi:hypothetical protein
MNDMMETQGQLEDKPKQTTNAQVDTRYLFTTAITNDQQSKQFRFINKNSVSGGLLTQYCQPTNLSIDQK